MEEEKASGDENLFLLCGEKRTSQQNPTEKKRCTVRRWCVRLGGELQDTKQALMSSKSTPSLAQFPGSKSVVYPFARGVTVGRENRL